MKIGIVCYPTYGGSGVVATELGKALAQRGHQVHFIAYKHPARLDSFMSNIFYHVVNVSTYPLFDFPPYETSLASTLVDVVKFEKLDILHVHYAIPHASAAYTAKQIVLQKTGRAVPVITTLHGTDITLVGRDKTYEPVVTFSINESDSITAVSDNLRAETFKHFDIKKEIEVIHNFVDVQRYNKKPVAAFRQVIAPNNEKIIIHASNFRKIKRIDNVMEIFKNIHAALPAKLLMVGDGPERPIAEDLTRQYGLEADIRFLGKQEQMEEILAVSDVFLLPSEYESFGLAALEAMAASTVVISSDAGGLNEININGVTGFTSPVGDVADMSKNAIELLQDEAKLKAFKQNALKEAKLFDIHHIIPKYEALYRKFCRTGDC
jgi:N-acetyl-alpha-D-glucosaminyl L-malate synthase BshA